MLSYLVFLIRQVLRNAVSVGWHHSHCLPFLWTQLRLIFLDARQPVRA